MAPEILSFHRYDAKVRKRPACGAVPSSDTALSSRARLYLCSTAACHNSTERPCLPCSPKAQLLLLQADLWSVGTILYELLTGRPPFSGNNHVDLLRNIERADARLPDGLRHTLSPAAVGLVSQAGSSQSVPCCAWLPAAGSAHRKCRRQVAATWQQVVCSAPRAQRGSEALPNLVHGCAQLLRRNPVERISFDEFFKHPFLYVLAHSVPSAHTGSTAGQTGATSASQARTGRKQPHRRCCVEHGHAFAARARPVTGRGCRPARRSWHGSQVR